MIFGLVILLFLAGDSVCYTNRHFFTLDIISLLFELGETHDGLMMALFYLMLNMELWISCYRFWISCQR